MEAYSLTNNKTYLTKAKQIVEFLKSGEDNTFGGGLCWNEDEKNIPGNNSPTKTISHIHWHMTVYWNPLL